MKTNKLIYIVLKSEIEMQRKREIMGETERESECVFERERRKSNFLL